MASPPPDIGLWPDAIGPHVCSNCEISEEVCKTLIKREKLKPILAKIEHIINNLREGTQDGGA